MISSRLARLDSLLDKSEFAGIALNAGPSLSYLTGLDFHLMERPVVLLYTPDSEPVLILPRLEEQKISEIKDSLVSFFYDENPDDWPEIFAKALHHAKLGSQNIGVEPCGLRVIEYTLLQQAAPKALFTDGSKIFGALRCVKDDDEINSMQRAVDIAQNALLAIIPLIKIGMEEKEVASELVMQLLRHGSSSTLPFSPIVSGGPNSANPHASPSSRKLKEGDLLVIDWGASYQGYVSDLTRTFAVGEVDKQCAEIHQLVQRANEAGRAAGHAGTPCAGVDRAARQVIESGGYGEYFRHRTGHGLGRECHEEPYIRGDNEIALQVGVTYTVEPGIYLPGNNGVRIEDDVLVTNDGPVSLSSLPREMVYVG